MDEHIRHEDSTHDASQQSTKTSASGRLLGAADIRRIAADAGISPTKKFGQNFVIDPGTVRRIVREAGVTATTKVLEVGPGLGSLTLALLEMGAEVTAVEIDSSLAIRLPQTVAEFMPEATGRLTVINADALSLSPENLQQFAPDPNPTVHTYTADNSAGTNETAASASGATPHPHVTGGNAFTLVSNLPYNVATPILLTLLERFPNLSRFLVMVQKEVADRLVAQPGNKVYGAPSVKLAWYGKAERVGLVGRNVFWPAPNVDSALVSFHRFGNVGGDNHADRTASAGLMAHDCRADHEAESPVAATAQHARPTTYPTREAVFRLVDAAFGQRRKTLRAALKGLVLPETFEASGIDPTRRGETLSIQEFTALAESEPEP